MKWLLVALLVSACAKKGSVTDPTPTASPSPSIVASLSTWCGDMIESVDGMAFEIDPTTGDVHQIQDGVYGSAGGANFWGVNTPPCWYQIVDGVPQASNGGAQ